MVISASRRTDIPCYYGEWFMNRLSEGYVMTRNPMNRSQVRRVPLNPHEVDCIVFWTKDAKNMIPHLDQIVKMGYKYLFHFTLTPYDKSIEKNLRDKKDIENTFIELSKIAGKECVVWRYDPIIINDKMTIEYHKKHFERLCRNLCNYTEQVVISYVDGYNKIKNKLVHKASEDKIAELSEFIGKTAKDFSLKTVACCEPYDLSAYGIRKASCIDKSVIGKICGQEPNLQPDRNQRQGCGCVKSIDIGAYNTCMNGCIYCYANHSVNVTEKYFSIHNPSGEFLID